MIIESEEEYHPYFGALHVDHFAQFLHRVLHPVIDLEEDVDLFLNSSLEFHETSSIHKTRFHSILESYDQMQHKARVVAFLHDPQSYPTSKQLFREAAVKMANREDLRFAQI